MYVAVNIEKNEITKLISDNYLDMIVEIEDDTSFVYLVDNDLKRYGLAWKNDDVDMRSISYWEMMLIDKAIIR